MERLLHARADDIFGFQAVEKSVNITIDQQKKAGNRLRTHRTQGGLSHFME
ncbi:hypothetical protein [Herbaspirillum autotrophicum]|uniref:hypothetical protein n=1 Tax=Herbaspirillum autotrophicum TaxID=180195 RepID=UPI0012ECED42|nr:hypothetical protein [Herbaspirillum autotrophicum]